MNDKIALEEHFAIPEYNEIRPHFLGPRVWGDIQRRIVDFTDLRLREMDECGIEYAVVSLTSPGVQGERDATQAVERARRSNDVLAKAVADRPDRFGGFAAVALQDVDAAVEELHRAVSDLGFHGVLVNSWTDLPDGGVGHLDLLRFDPFWTAVAELDVPLYLHPRLLPADQRGVVSDRPELAGPVWEFTTDTSASALRLITSGLFDRHPRVQVVLGHLGESLPYNIWRIENRMHKANDRVDLDRPLTAYLRENFWVTTSGHFCTPSLLAALETMGEDRVMFSVDYPYDEMPQGATWFDRLELPEELHRRVGRDNAVRLLSLDERLG
ncbi:amidohydrolase family protein [Geodermatophilus sp. SYSU D00697]